MCVCVVRKQNLECRMAPVISSEVRFENDSIFGTTQLSLTYEGKCKYLSLRDSIARGNG